MDLDFTSEQEMLRDAASKFFAKECPYEKVKELEESEEGYDQNLWMKMAERGWQALLFLSGVGLFILSRICSPSGPMAGRRNG